MTDPAAAARYVAIITDGNGRWAEQNGLPTLEGHPGSVTPSSLGSRS